MRGSPLRFAQGDTISTSIHVGFERQPFGFAQSLDDGFKGREYWRRYSGDRPERHADGPSSAFRPIGHVQSGDQPTNELSAFIEQLTSSFMELFDWNEQIARDQLAVAPAPAKERSRTPAMAVNGPISTIMGRFLQSC